MILTIYFHGPASEWGDSIAPGEIVGQFDLPWLWVARLKAKGVMDGLNKGRCGYIIQNGETIIEHVKASNQVLT